jgi:predicted DNA-binding protein YlxM (UPF0122 family)
MNLTCLIRARQACTVRKNYYNETSMATVASKENVNNQPCEFHQTNNLDKLFTDETSMARGVTKDNV